MIWTKNEADCVANESAIIEVNDNSVSNDKFTFDTDYHGDDNMFGPTMI